MTSPTHATVELREGRPWVGYLYLREGPIRSSRTRKLNDGLIADIDAAGSLLGLEFLEPRSFTLEAINTALASFGLPPTGRADLPDVLARVIEASDTAHVS